MQKTYSCKHPVEIRSSANEASLNTLTNIFSYASCLSSIHCTEIKRVHVSECVILYDSVLITVFDTADRVVRFVFANSTDKFCYHFELRTRND